jgi:hypothetical protein
MGSVTNPTGSVSGISLTGLVDAASYAFSGSTSPQGSAPAQWQFVTMSSDHSNVCLDANGTFQDSEITLRFVFSGFANLPSNAPVYPPSADLPLTIPAISSVTTSDGVNRYCKPYFMKARNGKAGNDKGATSGTVTVTQWDSNGITLSWDLHFNGDSTTGGLTAQWCGTPP